VISQGDITLPALTSIEDIYSEILEKDPIYFIEKYRMVKGFNFCINNTGRDYLKEIFHYICFEAPKIEGRPLVMVKGRQVEMTETMLNVCLYFLNHFTDLTILYAFPTSDQVRRFSNDRFNGAIHESQGGKLKDMVLPRGKQNVHHKQFRGNTQIFLYSAWGQADALRGIACDMLVKDEIQDWTKGGIQNTQESMTQSLYKVDLSLGTPKSDGTYYHTIWKRSDKRYFFVKCIHCTNSFMITLNICKRGTMIECPKCKKLQDKKQAIPGGHWEPTVENPTKTDYVGFHLSQLVHPNITIEEIYRKKTD